MADQGLTHPSPHHNARPLGVIPTLIVLHADAGKSDAGTLAWLQNPTSEVSYHALVGRDAAVHTCVDWMRRAWHAGKSVWQGVSDVNDFAIGLAFCNRHDGAEPLTADQIRVMQGLVQYLRQKWPHIEVTTHAAIAPGRKTDPLHCPGFRLEDYLTYPPPPAMQAAA